MRESIYHILIRILSWVVPLKQNKVIFLSYYGSQYGCNPKYISQYMVNHSDHYDIVWAFNDPDKYNIAGIRTVKYYTFRFFCELCTAKVIVTNYRMPLWFDKRKGQYYIQTWHSSLRLKTIEKDAESKLPEGYVDMAKKDSQAIDCLISGCQYSTEIFRSAFWYDGEVLECGTPRNDMFFMEHSHLKQHISKAYGIPETNKLLLYAPTFRQHFNFACYKLDYEALKAALTERFGGEWSILVRLHPHLRPYSEELLGGKNIVDVTNFDDIQELLGAADVLISDYSSLVFDYTFTKRPCFLYVSDLAEYVQEDRKLYFNINELPFIKAYSNQDLVQAIKEYDEKAYQRALIQFNRQIGSFEQGTACQAVLDYIQKALKR